MEKEKPIGCEKRKNTRNMSDYGLGEKSGFGESTIAGAFSPGMYPELCAEIEFRQTHVAIVREKIKPRFWHSMFPPKRTGILVRWGMVKTVTNDGWKTCGENQGMCPLDWGKVAIFPDPSKEVEIFARSETFEQKAD